MPGQLTAQQAVTLTREYLKETQNIPYVDGFTTVTSGQISLLRANNQAYGVIARTGFLKADFPTTMTAGQREYALSLAAGKISDVSMLYSGVQYTLRPTTLETLNMRVRDWRQSTFVRYAGRPRQYYVDGGVYGLFPMPITSGILTVRAGIAPPDLTQTTDIFSGVPAMYHGAIPILAAAWVAISDAEDDAQKFRSGALLARFQSEYPEIANLVDARTVKDLQYAQTAPGVDDTQ